MYSYVKHTNFPVNITKKDLRMAKYIITALGGSAGELAAAIRYFSHKFTMPDDRGKALLNDIATEELGHCEMIGTIVSQLTKNATVEELEAAGLGTTYVEHGKGIFPSNSDGVPFTTAYISSSGDYLVDLYEDMAAEEKARASYEHLIDLAKDPAVIEPLLFLRQREVIHFNRFKQLYDYYKKMKNKSNY